MEINCFPARLNCITRSGGPSSFEEGWIRPQFSLVAFSTGGDGVVGVITFNHLPQIHEFKYFGNKALVHMDLGTPPEPGGEIHDSFIKNLLKKRILK